MSPHPYKSAPKSSFWSRAVSKDWDPSKVVCTDSQNRLIRKGDKVVSAGSCFASNIISYLEQAGLTYLRTEELHPAFQDLEPEALGYGNFSAAYGNIYTARQLLQLLKRCCNMLSPAEDRWKIGDEIVDPLRPGLRYRARSDREFELLTAQHLRKTYTAFELADVFIFTLGLTEAWVSRLDGTVFPVCPGTIAGCFDPRRHEFKNFSVAEIIADLNEFVNLLQTIKPTARIILTVSPVPLVATATDNHVLSATVYSKAVLRVAAEEVSRSNPTVSYFPAFEIISGPQAPYEFFEQDRRTVNQAGVDAVMSAMLAHCEVGYLAEAETGCPAISKTEQALHYGGIKGDDAAKISRMIIEAECEEAMTDLSLSPTVEATSANVELIRHETRRETSVLSLAVVDLQQRWEEERTQADAIVNDLRDRFAALTAALDQISRERDILAAAAARWFEAAIAITADHNPLTAPAWHPPHRWWENFTRRRNGNRRGLSPVVLADRACSARKWELAVRYYRDALDLNPKEPTIWLRCGYALQTAGKLSEAKTDFGKAFEYFGFPPTLIGSHVLAVSDADAEKDSIATPGFRYADRAAP
jgi:tetratricopeptide (TPR) repeat protein